jgi:hypothetical protein
MSRASFGIMLESERWMLSLPENVDSECIAIPEVWDKLEKIAEIKGLTKLSSFIFEDEEIWQDVLESLDEYDDPDRDKIQEEIQQKLNELTNQTEWFSPVEARTAIETMIGLIEYLNEKPNIFDRWGKEVCEFVISDLQNYVHFLSKVESRNIRFALRMN